MMRKQLPMAICMIFGFAFLIRFFSPAREMERFETVVLLYSRIIGGFALVLGLASLIRVNWVRIQRRAENWTYGIVTIAGFTLMFLVGAFGGLFIQKPYTLKLALADNTRGVCTTNADRTVATLGRPAGKIILKRISEAAAKRANPYPGEWRREAEPATASAPPTKASAETAPTAPATESQTPAGESAPPATESAAPTKATEPAAPLPPATLLVNQDGTGVLTVGEGVQAAQTEFTWTTEGGGRFFAAGFSQDSNKWLDWLFTWVYVPMDSTIFSLLAFYIASAAFRSMRARDATSALLLGAAVVVMLGRAPLTALWWDQLVHPAENSVMWSLLVHPFDGLRAAHPWLTQHHVPSLGQITEWLMTYPNTAAKRAILFGAGLAALAQSLRILVGIERPYMAGTGD
jgi:hypothetical protein